MDGATTEERDALQYLTSCNLANAHFLMEDSHAARETLLETPEYLDLAEKVKAQILCAKAAAFSLFSKESFPYALELYREGIKMDPESYNLHLGIGVTLRRIRRMETIDGIPSDEEEMALRTAVQMKRCRSSLIFLAESVREHARALTILRIDARRATKLNEEALALYTEVSEDPYADGKSLVRCGDGFKKLPSGMKNLQKAEECYLKAHNLSPSNNMVNHKLGIFYSHRNHLLAEKYLSAAINPSRGKGNFAAHTTYVSLKLDHDPMFDVETEWQIMLERYPELIDQIHLHLFEMQYFSQFDPKTGLHRAKDALDILLQMKKPIQVCFFIVIPSFAWMRMPVRCGGTRGENGRYTRARTGIRTDKKANWDHFYFIFPDCTRQTIING